MINNNKFLCRPGSVEVTSALTVPHQNDITGVQQALGIYNKSGIIGNMSWIVRYWGPEGKLPCSVFFIQDSFSSLTILLPLTEALKFIFKSLVTMSILLSLSSSNLVLLLLLLLFAVEAL